MSGQGDGFERATFLFVKIIYLCSIVKVNSKSSHVYYALSKLIQKIIDYRRNKLTTNEK